MSEFSRYVKNRANILGRSESSVRPKLYKIGVKSTDSTFDRNRKILGYMRKGKWRKI